ncbi:MULTISPECIES: HlyD family secretion protein [unclassified Sphingomonas]|jgi:membrane fusion protein|uniref:HlyD family secretion protein n=1 Tax=unclassified Sphingomonas TaxID=196159 RepID=UPI00082BB9A3|nr:MULTISPECIES: HlyD family efflux transporter periplasmic adaptor subunit [unclassified Sphingomonas]
MPDHGSMGHHPPAADLFRAEAIESQARRLHGAVILTQSFTTKVATAALAFIAFGAFVWVSTAQYARIETVRGILVPAGAYAKIHAQRPGTVTSLYVRENDIVDVGATLAVVTVETPNAAGGVITLKESEIIDRQLVASDAQSRLAQDRAKAEVVRHRNILAGVKRQIATLAAQLRIRTQLIASLRASTEKAETLANRGYVTRTELERRQQVLLSAEEVRLQLEQQKIALEADVSRILAEIQQAELNGRSEEAAARIALSTLQRQQTRLGTEFGYSVKAPVSGQVTALQIAVGRSVTPIVPLMTIIPPDTKLKADLYLPTKAVGFVKRGQEVKLLYDAFPYQKFGSYSAKIENISRVALSADETGAPLQLEGPVYRITVQLSRQQIEAYGQKVALQPGMTLVANIVLERQSLVDWLLDPLRAVAERI